MELSNLQLKRKQFLSQELSLPVILQKIGPPIPQTSARRRKLKHSSQHASETTISPEDQHLQDQIRYLFLSKQNNYSAAKNFSKSNPRDSSYQKQKKIASLPRIIVSHQNIQKSSSHNILGQVKRPKVNLETILQNKNDYVQQYFTQLKQKNQRINFN